MAVNTKRQIAKVFNDEAKRIERAKIIALNRAGRSALSQTIKHIRDIYNVSSKVLKDEIKISIATKTHQRFRLKISHKAIGLVKFGARQTKKGVSAMEQKGKRKFYPGAFLANVHGKQGLSNHVGIFKRKGKDRLPIEELYGPSAMQVMSTKKAEEFIQKIFFERLEIEVKRALIYGR